MTDTNEKTPPKQICSIRIMFQVDTDEQAIEYKKKIGDVLADIPGVRNEFSLSTIPSGINPNAGRIA